MAHDVFICHASEDRAIADAVVAGLERDGITCWVAPRNVMPGSDYAEAIVAAISGARVLVLVFSQHSNRSPHVSREVERAVSRGIDIIPLRVEQVEPSRSLEYFISSAQWLDASSGSAGDYVGELAKIIRVRVYGEPGEGPRAATKEILRDLLDRYGPELTEDPRRLQALLRDVAGEHRAEVAALFAAAEEGVGAALLNSSQGLTPELVERLVRRLQQNRALAEDASRWAVNAWVYALGIQHTTPPSPNQPVPDQPGPSDLPETVAATPTPPDPTPPPVPAPAADLPQTVAATPDPPAPTSKPPLPSAPPPPATPRQSRAPAAPSPAAQHAMPPPKAQPKASERPPPDKPRKKRRRRIWVGTGVAVLALGYVGSLVDRGDNGSGDGPGDTTAATTTTRATTTVGVASTVTADETGQSDTPYSMPYTESFDDRVNIFESAPQTSDLGTRRWDIEGGLLTLEATAAAGRAPIFAKTPWFSLPGSYLAGIDVSQLTGDGVSCGIQLIDADNDNRLYFLIDAIAQEFRVLESTDDGTARTFVGPAFESSIQTSQPNQVDVIVAGEEYAFMVNGITVAEVSAPATTGKARIGPTGSVAEGTVEQCTFDDFFIVGLDEDLPPAAGAVGLVTFDPSAFGADWEISDFDESQTELHAFPIHCGGPEASSTVRLDAIESQSYVNQAAGRQAYVLVAQSEPDLIDALFASERANLAFCDAGGGFLRPVESTTAPNLGSDSLAGRSLLGSSDDTQFTMIKVSATTVLYTLLYDPFIEMTDSAGNEFAATVYSALFDSGS